MLYTWTDQVCNPVVLWRNLCYAMLHFYNRNQSYEKLHNNWFAGYYQIWRNLDIHDLNVKVDFDELQTLFSLERKEIIRIYLFYPIKIKLTTTCFCYYYIECHAMNVVGSTADLLTFRLEFCLRRILVKNWIS